MNQRTLWPAIVACFVLLGCAAPGGRHGGIATGNAPECPGTTCRIDVVVECASSCTAKADPKIAIVLNRVLGAKVIQWNLIGAEGFRFADDGVKFESGAPFQCNSPQADKITCTDQHQSAGAYSYTLGVVKRSDPSMRIPVDPWVVNK
jgi:hypothetical protein